MMEKFLSTLSNCKFDLSAINKNNCAMEMTISGWVKSLIIFEVKCNVKCNEPIYDHIIEELGDELAKQEYVVLILDDEIGEKDLGDGKYESEIIFERL